ncbi:hypothetical protein O181_117272 [Austropuccinia psidii MF-1]|uniref:Uncharacterized protein n=1 Tax=Austropuccinia psidii MF-1 TaxID=1389203 RepID=A0A9Q3KAY2_9BASI|nr:hypothetical protein [Austropuccinia psidii MF-1]
MLHTQNGSNYSVQPVGCGEGRGKTRSRSRNSSLRKTCLEDARVAPHFPRSVPESFDINSEPELLQGNFSRANPFTSFSHRDISVPVKKLVQSSQERRVGNIPKPLAGAMSFYLPIKSFLGQEKTIELLGGWSTFPFKEKVNKMKNKSILSIDKKKELEITPAVEKESPVVSNSSRSVQIQAQRTSEEAERSQ